ncbi:hypothetical protein F2P81_015294 [Scophthalmus maximus]|uniref:Uncharacterized protein n=1 Tax=Scophthalmus maximus TaxID=52904 RepID=A0A6A4SPL6_SCOMX|nr:hypothetical protein F2P81_015294 [Scophthalmus maximus]
MLVPALLQTLLVLWLAQQTLQGGVGVGVKPGVAGALGALGNRYGSKAMKTGLGRFTGAHLGTGAGLGAGMPLGTGLTNGLGLGLGQGGRRAYGAGLDTVPGYGALGAMGYPRARPGIGLGYPNGQRTAEQIPGYTGGAGNYLGAGQGNGGYGAGLGQGAYLGGAAGKLAGYGDGVTGYLGAGAGNGYGGDAGAKALAAAGYGNGYSDGYGAGGGAAQVPYGNAPVIPTGLEGDGGYPYSAQSLSLSAEGAKTANKYGEQPGKYGGVNGAHGNGYKG